MESHKDVTKAVPILNDSQNISSQEFQGLLASWYEEKGILSQIRTQIRYKMINVLKNTAIGRDITRKTSQTSISLSKQAVNLIVAEFLMKSKCDYSLSLFNTEASLTNTYCDNLINESGKISLHFDKENIVNILELIGIHKMSELCDDILSLYYENNDNTSLLYCLINILSKTNIERNYQPDLMQKSHIDLNAEPDFIRQIGNVLMDSNISLDNVLHVIQMIKCLHKNEIENLEQNYGKALLKLKKALAIKEKQIEHVDKKKKLVEFKLVKIIGDYNTLKHQMKNVIKDKLHKEEELYNLRNNFKEHNKTFTDDNELEKDKDIICNIDHCGAQCKENNLELQHLQNENQQLRITNTKQANDLFELQKKYSDLLHDFHFLQNKVSLLDLKVNEDTPSSHLNLNLIEGDINYINKEHRHKKIDLTENSDSLTEDVIRDARLRLEKLERESKEIEDFQEDLMNDLV